MEAFLESEQIDNLRQWGEATRDLATALLGNLFQSEVMIENPDLRPTTMQELEAMLPMPVLMAQVDLLLATGDLSSGMLFIGVDDASLIFELAPGMAGADGAEQPPENRVADVLNNLADALNRSNPGEGSFAVGAVLPLDSPEALADALQGLGTDQLAEVSYSLALPNIIEGRVVHVLPLEFLSKLNALVGGEEMAPAPPPPRAAPSAPEPRPAPMPSPERDRREPPSFGFGGGPEPAARSGRSAALDLGALDAGFGPGEPTIRPAQFGALGGASHTEQAPSNIDLLLDVTLSVTVELGRTSMTVRDVLALGPGSIIELEKLAGEPVEILVNDRPIAKGEVVVVDENFGVRVTDILTPAKRVALLR